MEAYQINRTRLVAMLAETVKREFSNDPVVEVLSTGNPGQFRMRVGQNSGGPRYFRVQVTEEK